MVPFSYVGKEVEIELSKNLLKVIFFTKEKRYRSYHLPLEFDKEVTYATA
ncbi:MAG: hypothetical protein J7J10_01375 [Deltaproteobacteria bacterium]|nr:hypothetical protein [Deltaproteobacteria bacterium]